MSRSSERAERLQSGAALARRHASSHRRAGRHHLGPAGWALALTVVWYVVNVRHASLLDVLPFAWTWLTLAVAFWAASGLWQRWSGRDNADGPRS